ncbi:MAG: enolase C-terminal domain-like protein [Desulfobacterales bacterium]|nr:enolase C-terminal domain-like protein [Desulfobacterales bacterium]
MSTIKAFELRAVDLPFKKPFKHSAAERRSSYSILLKCVTEDGVAGYGECLPREYVTGESRHYAFTLLADKILPRLVGRSFKSLVEVKEFLSACDGKAPPDWGVAPDAPQTAAWATVDLALLDTFGKVHDTLVRLGPKKDLPAEFHYSVVSSASRGFKAWRSFLLYRLMGFRAAKLKIDSDTAVDTARLARWIMGRGCDLRADANMAWDVRSAISNMRALSHWGIRSFEQPLAADDFDGLATLVKETGLGVMADESLNDAASLETLIERKACTAINARISKCGGLVATYNRCRRALEAGLTVQVGCQVGETSLLSAAQLILIAAVRKVTYGEGCFGHYLLREDPFLPLVQFGRGGLPPALPDGPGLGVRVQEDIVSRHTTQTQVIT